MADRAHDETKKAILKRRQKQKLNRASEKVAGTSTKTKKGISVREAGKRLARKRISREIEFALRRGDTAAAWRFLREFDLSHLGMFTDARVRNTTDADEKARSGPLVSRDDADISRANLLKVVKAAGGTIGRPPAMGKSVDLLVSAAQGGGLSTSDVFDWATHVLERTADMTDGLVMEQRAFLRKMAAVEERIDRTQAHTSKVLGLLTAR